MGCSLPGSSVHGILQTRILERVTNLNRLIGQVLSSVTASLRFDGTLNVSGFFVFIYFGHVALQDLNSLIREQTHAPCRGRTES